jgi:hypothetical protein
LTLRLDSQFQIQIRPGEAGVVGKPGGNRNTDPGLRYALPSNQDLSVLPALGRVGLSGGVRGVSFPAPLLVGQQHIVAFFLRNRWRDGRGENSQNQRGGINLVPGVWGIGER